MKKSREALAKVAGFGDDLRRLDTAVEGLSALWLIETTERNERLFLRGLTRELSKSRLSNDERADEFRQRYVAYGAPVFIDISEIRIQTPLIVL